MFSRHVARCLTRRRWPADLGGIDPVVEQLVDRHDWLRVADPNWSDPLDPTFAAAHGGRWNPPHSFPTLYLNEDVVTARSNLRHWVNEWPYEPEDLLDHAAPVLVGARLPDGQRAADAHTPAGIAALGLPSRYPLDAAGETVEHEVCQSIGASVHAAHLDGVRCRSAQTPLGAGRELAWFPTSSDQAEPLFTLRFSDWFWH